MVVDIHVCVYKKIHNWACHFVLFIQLVYNSFNSLSFKLRFLPQFALSYMVCLLPGSF